MNEKIDYSFKKPKTRDLNFQKHIDERSFIINFFDYVKTYDKNIDELL